MTLSMEMSARARVYWWTVVLTGLAFYLLTLHFGNFHDEDLRRVSLYVCAAVVASGLKIRLPGILVTLSMNYVVIIAALLNLGLSAGLIVGIASALGQCCIGASRKLRWFQVVFSTSAMALPILAAHLALRSPLLLATDPSGCLSLMAASLSYFFMNTIIVAGIVSLTSGKGLFHLWCESYLWTSAQYLVGGGIAGGLHFMLSYMGWRALIILFPPLYLVYRSYTIYLGRVEEQQKHIAEMAELHLRTIETLALAIDAKDDTTAAHLRRVQIYASEIGRELGISEIEMKALEAAALLHDVGKLAVPEYIISKPGKLTPDEFEKMKVHPVVGAEILERVHFPYPVVPIVRSHHEKYDGTGYPDGLAGDRIPIGARILSAVDCLDALASNRQYRTAMPVEDAMEIVRKESGKSFDPRVVAILDRRFRDLELKAKADSADTFRLSSNVKVARGLAPATGLAQAAPETDHTVTNNFSQAISTARREFRMLIEVANDLGSSLSLEETLALLAVRLGKIIDHDAIAFYLLQGDKLVPRFVKGESFRLFSSLEIPLGKGLSGWVAENELPLVNGNPSVEAGYLDDPRLVTPLRSAISVPLRGRDGVVGVVTLYHLKTEAFTADHRRILLAISPKAGVAVENSLCFERAINAADTDSLTGLRNARSLFTHLEQELANSSRRAGSFAVIVMDLDGFKKANDEHGHLAGNRVLQAVAAALRANCRAGDFIARLGGDEFVVIMPEAGHCLAEVLAKLNDIGDWIASDSGCDATVSMSVGVSSYPEDGQDGETLLEKADERMYEAKRRKLTRAIRPESADEIACAIPDRTTLTTLVA
jgi:diguanylate cyclase (GGDEF)-like protein/putative nucleotidyltransferase with HDIG domain